MAKTTKPISLTEFAKEIVHLLEMGFSEGDVGEFFRRAVNGVYPKAQFHRASAKIAKYKDQFSFSKSVLEDPEFESLTTGKIRQEHVVPVSVLITHWKENKAELDKENSDAWVKNTLDNALHVCIITKEEDKKLNKLGLRSSMPDGWKWTDGTDGKEFYARYNQAGIVIPEKQSKHAGGHKRGGNL